MKSYIIRRNFIIKRQVQIPIDNLPQSQIQSNIPTDIKQSFRSLNFLSLSLVDQMQG